MWATSLGHIGRDKSCFSFLKIVFHPHGCLDIHPANHGLCVHLSPVTRAGWVGSWPGSEKASEGAGWGAGYQVRGGRECGHCVGSVWPDTLAGTSWQPTLQKLFPSSFTPGGTPQVILPCGWVCRYLKCCRFYINSFIGMLPMCHALGWVLWYKVK